MMVPDSLQTLDQYYLVKPCSLRTQSGGEACKQKKNLFFRLIMKVYAGHVLNFRYKYIFIMNLLQLKFGEMCNNT